MNDANLIKLSFINGKAMTFNATDYFKIRTENRVVGKLIGVPVIQQRNLICHSLPAFYNEYETKLLIEEGIVILEDKSNLKKPPDETTKEEYKNHLKLVETDLQKPYIEARLELTKQNMEHIIKGKTKKLMKSGASAEDIKFTPEDILKEEEDRIQQSISTKNVYVHIPTKHPFFTTNVLTKNFSVKDIRKYKVFKDLWNKGFLITQGDSFGCDFLIYPADPMYFHASHVVHIVDQDQAYDPKCLIGWSRLAVTVNKKCLFAYVNENSSITYQNLSWDNPKLRQLYPQQVSFQQNEEKLEENIQTDSEMSDN